MKKVPKIKSGGFGDYLVSSQVITHEQYLRAKAVQNTNRLMGIIAKGEKYLTETEIEKIIEHLLEHPLSRFGDTAVELGFMDSGQLRHLLHLCMARKTRIGEILLNLGFLNPKSLADTLADYHAKRSKLKKVLLAEPAHDVSAQMGNILTKYGYEVRIATNGKEVSDALAEFKPNILILSASPEAGLNLDQILGNVAAGNDKEPIQTLLLSAVVNREIIDKAYSAGVKHVIKKSCKESEFIDVIMQVEGMVSGKRAEKILVVDDSPLARKVILEELSQIWSDIHVAENGEQGVRMAKELQPDIVTMDVEMPVMNGMDACRNMRNDPATENIPVIFITANNTVAFREEGFAVGAVEYFAKPFKNGQLAIFIRSLFEMKNSQKDGKIMIVEDSPSSRHILSYFLQKNGYNVYGARSGKESLSAIADFKPDLVVTDISMPDMDGYELTKRLKVDQKLRSIPVIMLTSSTNRGGAIQGLKAGAVDYITKPFDESEMIARLQVHIKNKQLMEQVVEDKEKLEETLSKLEEANKMLEQLAVSDGLTGLSNRRHFDEVMAVEWSRALREKKPISFMMMDIDFFKKFNDGYGHQQGDTCIKLVASAVRDSVKRPTDLPARYGGEEFAVIMPLTPEEGGQKVAERIRETVDAMNIPHQFSGAADHVTVSVGVVTIDPLEGDVPKNYKEFIELADKALYAAKHGGRNRVCKAEKYSPPLADAPKA